MPDSDTSDAALPSLNPADTSERDVPADAHTPGTPALPLDAAPITSFAELNLSAEVLENVAAAGFTKPTPIQAQFIPKALSGRDVIGQAKTGTGKTAAFLLPIYEMLRKVHAQPLLGGDAQPPAEAASQHGQRHHARQRDRSRCRALILAPTRELALQIHGETGRLGATLGFTSITLYGGASYEPQIEALSSGVDIVVGTPGRIMDHMRSHRLDLSAVNIAVLDEADRMLDMGFRKDIEYIMRHCPAQRQTFLLSATIPDEIKKLARRYMIDPLEVWTAPESITVDAVEQQFFVCERQDKFNILLKLLDIEDPALAIIFCGTKMGARRLAEKLKRLYINAREIHGDLQQSKREKILARFRTGQVRLLIATDVASRGLDVQNITHIINYDIPYKIEDYVHRIGRTGRMEKSGKAFTFVTREEGSYLTEIELLINKEIKRAHFDDLTSRYWPVPPKAPGPEFIAEDEEGAGYLEEALDKGRDRSSGGSRGDRSRSHSQRGRSSGGSRAGSLRGGGASGSAGVPPAEAPKVLSPAQNDTAVSRGEGEVPALAGSNAGTGSQQQAARGTLPAGERKHRRGLRGKHKNVPIVCSACGCQAMVNFLPQPGRPVYCDACFSAQKAARGTE